VLPEALATKRLRPKSNDRQVVCGLDTALPTTSRSELFHVFESSTSTRLEMPSFHDEPEKFFFISWSVASSRKI
jgi:hypothetical protein